MDDETYALHITAGRAYGREATCGAKVDYKSEATAQRAVEALDAKGRMRHPLEAYPCAWCGGWHLGRVMSPEELRAVGDAEPTRTLGLENSE